MSDFCEQCSAELKLGPTTLAGITTPETYARGFANLVLCEGCGPIQVDPQGRCISEDCYARQRPGEHRLHLGKPAAAEGRAWRYCRQVLGQTGAIRLTRRLRAKHRLDMRTGIARLTLIVRSSTRQPKGDQV